jgi:RimJ/RimL family protein N-acetyltransferase
MTSNVTVSLEPYIQKHVLKTFKWVLNPELRKLFLMRGVPTWGGHTKHFERVLHDPTQRVYAVLAGDEHVGNCGLKNLSPLKTEGELWIYIGEPSMREKGIGKHATELLLHEGFEVLGLKMIYGRTANVKSSVWS